MVIYQNPIAYEKDTIIKMIRIYCQGVHNSKQSICNDCQELLDYAIKRLDRCKFGNDKPTCERCTVHCYKPEMRDKVRVVMRYSGPRMLFKYPLIAVRHMLKNNRARNA